MTGIGEQTTVYRTKLYTVMLINLDGDVFRIQTFGIEKIASDRVMEAAQEAARNFLARGQELVAALCAEVDLLIGMNNVELMLVKTRMVEGLAVYQSNVGTGWLLGGTTGGFLPVQFRVQVKASTPSREETASNDAGQAGMPWLSDCCRRIA